MSQPDRQGARCGQAKCHERALGRPLGDQLWSRIRQMHDDTAGNPLFLDILLSKLSEQSEHPAASAGRTLTTTVERRVARQPVRVSETLQMAALAGAEFDLRVVARASGHRDSDTLSDLESAHHAGLVQEEAVNRYRFRHAVVRGVLRERLSRSRLARMHLKIAEAIEAVHPDALEEHAGALAFHYFQANAVGGGSKAYHYTLRAAQQATQLLAHDEAVNAYEQAIKLKDQAAATDESFNELLLLLGQAQRRAGNLLGALETFRAVTQVPGPPEQLAQATIAFEDTNYWLGYPGDEAANLTEQAVAVLPVADLTVRALTLAGLSRALRTGGRTTEGIKRGKEALALAERLGDPVVSFAVAFRTTQSSLSVARAHLHAIDWTKLYTTAREMGDMDACLLGLAEAMWATAMLGDVASWDEMFAEYCTSAEQLRQPRWDSWLQCFRAFRSLLAADLEGAEQALERSEQIAEGFGWAREGLYGVAMFLIRREQGRLAELLHQLQAAVRMNPSALWRPGLAALYADLGRLDDARPEFEAVLSEGLAGFADGSWDLGMGLLAEVCVALGDVERASLFLELLRPCEGRFLAFLGCAAGLGPVDRLLGMLASLAGRREDALKWHTTGLELARRMNSPLWIAHCLCDFAAHVLAADQLTARRMLAEAAAICEEHRLLGLGRRVEGFGTLD